MNFVEENIDSADFVLGIRYSAAEIHCSAAARNHYFAAGNCYSAAEIQNVVVVIVDVVAAADNLR